MIGVIILYNNDEKQQRVVLVAADIGTHNIEASLEELNELAVTAGAEVVGIIQQNLKSINNATYLGTGKVEEIRDFCQIHDVDLLIFNDELSGAQIKNIEDVTQVNIIDRTMLILDIFAMRALTNEGKLQVELAQQKYLLPRLYGMGSQLSRQGGGIGTRGPGETKLESDKRHIRRRIESLEQELRELALRRDRIRKRRAKGNVVTIAIVGYTNVGKSTLLNLLTDAGVLVKNQLFATLDPTARELKLNDGQTAIFIDTVGLIQRLPHQLVQAFKSTLEEAASADIILNLCDISNKNVATQLEVTQTLLNELGCGDKPMITVYNKIDKMDGANIQPFGNKSVSISAQENIGIDDLMNMISDILKDFMKKCNLLIPYSEAALLDQIRKLGKILSEEYQNDGILVEAIVDKKMLYQVEQYEV